MNMRRLVIAALVLLGTLLLVGAGIDVVMAVQWSRGRQQATNMPVPYSGKATLAQLQQLPELQLYYPGSVVLDPFGHPSDFRNAATWGYELGVQASPNDVLAFYRQQLPTLGWIELIDDPLNARGTSEVRVQTWYKGGTFFRYAEQDQTHPFVGQSSYRTVYSIAVRNMRSDELKYLANLTPTPPQRTPSPIH